METNFIPTNPEELVGFDNILEQFNEINGTNYRFTNNYQERNDIYVGTETTADGYEIWVVQIGNNTPALGDGIYYYEPSPYEIIEHMNGVYKADLVCYIENDDWSDLEYYMLEELRTNYFNYLDENGKN